MRQARWLAFSVAFVASGWSARASADESDKWWARDKALHFGVSAAIAAGGYAASTPFVEARWKRATIGSGLALGAGAGKELYDLSGHGHASWKDFAWDAIGAAVGTAIALLVDVALDQDDKDGARSSAIVRF